jgi:hypothetical protein
MVVVLEFSRALSYGSIYVPRELFEILYEVFGVKEPVASGLAVARRDMSVREVEEAIRKRSFLFHDTRYLLVDSPDFPGSLLWMKTVYVYTDKMEGKNIAEPKVIDPMPCRRLYGDPVALDELLVCRALYPLIGRHVVFKAALIFKARKKVIDVDVEGLCRGVTSVARRYGGVPVYLPIVLRQSVDKILGALEEKGIDPEILRSGSVDPLADLVDEIIAESMRLSGLEAPSRGFA